MLFFLTKELWQSVRHFARHPLTRQNIWYWRTGCLEDGLRLHSDAGSEVFSAILARAVETSRERVSVVVASRDLSEEFKHVVDRLAGHRGDLRISMMLTSRLDDAAVDAVREFLRENRHLETRVSSFVLSSRLDSDFVPLEPEAVEDAFLALLQLLCGGRESLATDLGIFRAPVNLPVEEIDDVQADVIPDFRPMGMVAVSGVQSWIPRKQKIVELTRELFSALLGLEERAIAPQIRVGITPPEEIIRRALHLSQSEEPLSLQHFVGEIPNPPDSPVESWKVPVSARRARKERRHLRRLVQLDFSNYTASLQALLDNITSWLEQQSEAAYIRAAHSFKSEVFKDAELATLRFLLREHYPAFESRGQSVEEFAEGPSGWPPDQSHDCFSDVYEALEEGLEELPSSKAWGKAAAASMAFIGGAWVFRDADWFIPLFLFLLALVCPAILWVHRTLRLSELRRQVVQLSDGIYANLRRTYCAELEQVLRRTRMRLEERIRNDGTKFGAGLRHEFEAIPLLTAEPDVDWDNIQEEIQRLRLELIGAGIDETRFERLASRMGRLARGIIEEAGGEPPTGPEPEFGQTPREMAEDWLDELVGAAVLPLDKVEGLQDEIIKVAGSWRSPPLMAPVTDAELHRGFRKVVIVPNTDIVYHNLIESLPRYSGNPVVNLKLWTGPVPGVAVCSVMTGLPDTVLEHHAKVERPA